LNETIFAMVSIIIPTADRGDSLRRTLESLVSIAANTTATEVLVIDNGSGDLAREAFEHTKPRNAKAEWHYIYEPVPGLLSGRHRGALEAKGDICVFIDDDVIVHPEWLTAIIDCFRDPAVALAGGPSAPIFEKTPPDWLDSLWKENDQGRFCGWLSLFDGGKMAKSIDPCYVWGLNFAIRKSALFEAGGFHPDSMPQALQKYQGDGETGLSLKLRMANAKTIYHPGISLSHIVPESRLNLEYFKRRSFFQAVCDSYTALRARDLPEPRWAIDSLRHAKRDIAKAWNILKRGTKRTLQDILTESYGRGSEFHRTEVRRDPTLLDWVRRKDYWDYDYRVPVKGGKARP
jgi:glucosyl-dolichyl phosphate glucuronosyltransferase